MIEYVLVLWWICIVNHLAFIHRKGGFIAVSSQWFTVEAGYAIQALCGGPTLIR